MQRRRSVDTKKIGHLDGSLAVFWRHHWQVEPKDSTHLDNLTPGLSQASPRPLPGLSQAAAMRQNVLYFFLAMIKFSSVNKACDFLTLKTNKRWEAKFEILHGKRFYFVYRCDSMPFHTVHRTLICRGNKEQILQKLARVANSPILPQLPTKTFYRRTVSGSVIQWDEPGENF
jgi:hypothetical protein